MKASAHTQNGVGETNGDEGENRKGKRLNAREKCGHHCQGCKFWPGSRDLVGKGGWVVLRWVWGRHSVEADRAGRGGRVGGVMLEVGVD